MLNKILKFKNAIMWILGIIILFWSNILYTKKQVDTIDDQNEAEPVTTGNGNVYTPPPATAAKKEDKKETQGLSPETKTNIKITGTLKPEQPKQKEPIEENTGDLINETDTYLNK